MSLRYYTTFRYDEPHSSVLSIPFGITIGLLASCVQSLGLTIQRKSHVLNQQLPEHRQRIEHRRPLWLLGFGIFISSNILGSLVQIASLPVVILAPLGAVSLLWNALFARFLLGDMFSSWMALGTLLIAGGAILIAIYGIVPEQTRSLEDLLKLFERPTFIIYFSLLGSMVLISLVITHIAEYSFQKRFRNTVSPPCSPATGLEEHSALETVIEAVEPVLVTETTPLLDHKSKLSPSARLVAESNASKTYANSLNRSRLILAIAYASFSGILSGMCLLFAKSGVELLVLTLQGSNQFWRWQAWMLVLGLVAFALLQLWYLHKALVLADPTLVCPSAFCFYNVSSIVNGLVYFDQFALISPLHLGLVTLGMFTLLAGVWVVSLQSNADTAPFDNWDDLDGQDVMVVEPSQTDVMSGPLPSVAEEPPSSQATSPDVSGAFDDEWGTQSEPALSGASNGILPNVPHLRPLSTAPYPPPGEAGAPSEARRLSRHRYSSSLGHGRYPTFDSFATAMQRSTSTASSPILNTTNSHPTVASLASTGFQIGLSPLSPGFSITTPRRRKTSGPDGVQPGLSVSHLGEERRRTVSEGDVRLPTTIASSIQPPQDSRDETRESHVPVKKKGKRRWTWFRRL